MKIEIQMEATVEITVGDEDYLRRAYENWDEDGNPVARKADGGPGTGWQDYLYQLDTREKVLEHLAYNAVSNGVQSASRLDGWADLPHDAITMWVTDVMPA